MSKPREQWGRARAIKADMRRQHKELTSLVHETTTLLGIIEAMPMLSKGAVSYWWDGLKLLRRLRRGRSTMALAMSQVGRS